MEEELPAIEPVCGAFEPLTTEPFEQPGSESYTQMLSDKDPMFASAAGTSYGLRLQENQRESFALPPQEGEGISGDESDEKALNIAGEDDEGKCLVQEEDDLGELRRKLRQTRRASTGQPQVQKEAADQHDKAVVELSSEKCAGSNIPTKESVSKKPREEHPGLAHANGADQKSSTLESVSSWNSDSDDSKTVRKPNRRFLTRRRTGSKQSMDEAELFLPDNIPQSRAAGRRRTDTESSTDGGDTTAVTSFESDENDSENDPNKLWCICREPYNNRFMICCDRCEDWFHGDCVGISVARGRQMEKHGEDYICPNCISKEEQASTAAGMAAPLLANSTGVQETEPGEVVISQGSVIVVTDNKEDIKGKIEKTKTEEQQKKKKRFLNKCAGTGCNKTAAPGSVYCSQSCILRHAASTMRALEREHVKSSPSNAGLGSTIPVVPVTRLTPGITSQVGTHRPLSVLDQKTRLVLVGPNMLTLTSSGSLLHAHQAGVPPRFTITPNAFYTIVQKPKVDAVSKEKEKEVAAVREPPLRDKKPEVKRKMETLNRTLPKDGQIRLNVRRSLGDILVKRLKDSESLTVKEDQVYKLSEYIERELYSLFHDTDNKYKKRYRSLMFNLKDTKNQGLFYRVIRGEISPSKLVRMSPEDLASKELAEWRERENKHTLEMIEKEQREIERRPITKITHKGEIEIEETALLTDREDSEARNPDAPDDDGVIAIDTTEKHKQHLFDSNCKICTGKIAPPTDEPATKKVRVATTVTTTNRRPSHELAPSADNSGTGSSWPGLVSPPGRSQEEKGPAASPLTSDSQVAGMEHRSPDHGGVPDARSFSFLKEVWKGFVNMPNVAKFASKAFPISGFCDNLFEDLPDTVQVGGRISPQVVWDYLSKVKATKEVCVIRFHPATEEEKVGYVSLYSYFSSRNRFGVVANNPHYIKDTYLIPLGSTDTIPHHLLPFDGPGLEGSRPNVIIGLVVRQRGRRHGDIIQEMPSLYEKERGASSGGGNRRRALSVDEESEDVCHSRTAHRPGVEEDDEVAEPALPAISLYSKSDDGVLASLPQLVHKNSSVDPIVQQFSTIEEEIDEGEDMDLVDENEDDEEVAVAPQPKQDDGDEAYDPEDESMFNTIAAATGGPQYPAQQSFGAVGQSGARGNELSSGGSLQDQQQLLECLTWQIEEQRKQLEEQEANLKHSWVSQDASPNAVQDSQSHIHHNRDPRQAASCTSTAPPSVVETLDPSTIQGYDGFPHVFPPPVPSSLPLNPPTSKPVAFVHPALPTPISVPMYAPGMASSGPDTTTRHDKLTRSYAPWHEREQDQEWERSRERLRDHEWERDCERYRIRDRDQEREWSRSRQGDHHHHRQADQSRGWRRDGNCERDWRPQHYDLRQGHRDHRDRDVERHWVHRRDETGHRSSDRRWEDEKSRY
uniref:Death-inducer obliterator 1 n=1 Tax=Eptatretus burgeri TaxID=7764 RepID=A0A8C4NEM5_EPTBU